MWHMAAELCHKGSSYSYPIEIAQVLKTLNGIGPNTTWNHIRPNDQSLVRSFLNKISADGYQFLLPPWPIFSDTHGRILHDAGSPEQLAQVVKFIYLSAMNEYQHLTDHWFEKLKFRMPHASILPAKLVASISLSQDRGGGGFWSIDWYVTPLPRDQINEAIVTFGDTRRQWDEEEVWELIQTDIRKYRSDYSHYVKASTSSGILSIEKPRPVTEKVTKWLRSDLYRLRLCKYS
jgi:hypothetical protein